MIMNKSNVLSPFLCVFVSAEYTSVHTLFFFPLTLSVDMKCKHSHNSPILSGLFCFHVCYDNLWPQGPAALLQSCVVVYSGAPGGWTVASACKPPSHSALATWSVVSLWVNTSQHTAITLHHQSKLVLAWLDSNRLCEEPHSHSIVVSSLLYLAAVMEIAFCCCLDHVHSDERLQHQLVGQELLKSTGCYRKLISMAARI